MCVLGIELAVAAANENTVTSGQRAGLNHAIGIKFPGRQLGQIYDRRLPIEIILQLQRLLLEAFSADGQSQLLIQIV